MCLIEKFTDVYPMEIRTRKVIHRCLFSDGRGTCDRTRLYDRGEFYHVRQAQPRSTRRTAPQRYTTIEPREARWQEEHRYPSPTRRSSQTRSRSFSFGIPIFRRPSEPSDRQTWHECRGSQSPPRPVVGFPEVEERRPRGAQPASPRVQYISPRTRRSPISTDSERANDADDLTRHARSRQPSRGPRPPRERTPVTEREPARRGLNRVVDIHNDPPASQHRDRRSAERRQVRFSSDVEYEKNVNSIRARDRSRFHGESIDARAPTHRGYPGSNGFARDAGNTSNRASHSRDTSPHPRAHSPYPGRERQRHQETNRYRPRIIQDGSRIISEAGERVLAEGWERHKHGNSMRDVEFRTHRRASNERSGPFRVFHWREESKDDRRHNERWS